MDDRYLDTVRLMLAIAPDVFDTPHFAMKGGTAINMFAQDLPRLSVDIDVAVRPHEPDREQALSLIHAELARVRIAIERQGYAVSLTGIRGKHQGDDVRLLASSENAQVKVDINYVFRGTLMPVKTRRIGRRAQALFRVDFALPTLCDAELYGGKLVAALDRQHPRDLFDVRRMFDSVGLTADIVDAFVAYLAGHNRPIHEVLFASRNSLVDEYEAGFAGMTSEAIKLTQLEATQRHLHETLPRSLNARQRQFLLSLVRLDPDWPLMPYPHLRDLPAIRWKLANLARLKARDRTRFSAQASMLQTGFAELGKT